MARNGNLAVARKSGNDEFYTQRADIEAELRYYEAYFRDKIVYCNCDDPGTSEFWKFFADVFESWGLRKLVATHYVQDEESFAYELVSMLDRTCGPMTDVRSVRTPLPCDGDFRSDACIELLESADVVVTNPPFSLFREYVAQLMERGKKFLVIGNMNAVTCKEIFPLLRDNRMWLGHTHPKRFVQLDGSVRQFGNVLWFTNLDIGKRHKPLDLRGNRYYGNESRYPRYDNYDAIECSRVSDIPEDYPGYIGVPITFLDKHCPEQFEVVGLVAGNSRATGLHRPVAYTQHADDRGGCGVINGKRVYVRVLIRRFA